MEFAVARVVATAKSVHAAAGILVDDGIAVVAASSTGALLHTYGLSTSSGLTHQSSFPGMPDEVDCGPVVKMKFLPEQRLLVLQSGSFVRCHLFDVEHGCFFPAVSVAADALDFDVVVLSEEQTVIAILRAVSSVTLFCVVIPSVMHISEFNVHEDVNRVTWVGKLLCVYGRKTPYAFHGVDSRGHAIKSISHNGCDEPQIVPLLETFQFSDETQQSAYAGYFAALVRSSDEGEFQYECCVYNDELVSVSRFLLLSRKAKLLGSLGPFVLCSGGRGIDLYYSTNGEHAQSFAELSMVKSVASAQSVVNLKALPCTGWFTASRRLLLINSDSIEFVETISLIDLVTKLASTLTLDGDDIPQIMMYAHSLGCKQLMVPPGNPEILTTSFFFTEYGHLLGRFPGAGGSHDPPAGSPMKRCMQCGRQSSSLKECYVCTERVCSQCSQRRDMRALGYSMEDGHTHNNGHKSAALASKRSAVVCSKCDGACDNNFYRLIVARMFLDVIDYRIAHEENCHQFDVGLVVDCVAKQCFAEGKLELCAFIVTKFIHENEMWSWVLKFASQKRIALLAGAFSPSPAREVAGSSILLQLVRHDCLLLLTLVQTWPRGSFSARVVVAAIEARLKFKLDEAYDTQRSCQTTKLSSEDMREAICTLYLDREVECLVRALVYILDTVEEDAFNAARGYAIHFLSFLPPKAVERGGGGGGRQRLRGHEVFNGETFRCSAGRVVREFLDWWELVNQQQVLEKLLASPDNKIFISALLARYRSEFVSLLVTGLDPTRSEGLLKFVVDELKASQSVTLMELLHELTQISVNTTFHYHQLLADLYLQHDPSRLISLVKHRQVSCLDWKKLLSETRERKMFAEMVYIVGRTGNDKEAIRIALRCLKDVRLGIQYAEDANDSSLWQDIESCVTQSSKLIGDFLDACVEHYNPEEFLRRIPVPNRLEIADVGGRLSRLLDARRVNKNIAEAYLGALEEDQLKLFTAQVAGIRRGVRVNPRNSSGSSCATCAGECTGEMFAATCAHVSHAPCHLARFEQVRTEKRSIALRPARNSTEGLAECAVARALGGTDLVDILPRSTVLDVMSFLTPTSVNACRFVSMRWRSVVREYAFSTCREDENLFRRAVSRSGLAESLLVRRTVHLNPLSTCAHYALRSLDPPLPVCFACGE